MSVRLLEERGKPMHGRDGSAARRIEVADLNRHGWPPELEPACFVCGPTGFVETVADILTGLGHDPRRVRTERFGPTGG